jgi:small subunit ribosomal protein S15
VPRSGVIHSKEDASWSATRVQLVPEGDNRTHKSYFFMAYLTAEKKQELFGKYGKSNTDTGSPESQIALFSYRISHLTEHLKQNKHDFGTQRSLLRLVGKRRKLLMYLKEVDIERYRAIIKTLNLRK